jgi:RNase P/RNase MRP subunit p30
MAARFAYDIRSPMSVLALIESEHFDRAEAKAVISQVIGRLQNITDDLIKHWNQEIKGQYLILRKFLLTKL